MLFDGSIAPQVIGAYELLELDPVSTTNVSFTVAFPTDYSTACIEAMECTRIGRNDPGYDTFEDDMETALAAVRSDIL